MKQLTYLEMFFNCIVKEPVALYFVNKISIIYIVGPLSLGLGTEAKTSKDTYEKP